jgi:hypothetical protein
MKGLPFLTKAENRAFSRLRRVFLRSQKYPDEGGDESMGQKKEVKTMTIAAMAHTLEETIPVEDSRVVARHGNNFVRIIENSYKNRVLDEKERRRNAAIKRLEELMESG